MCLADVDREALPGAREEVVKLAARGADAEDVFARETDVSRIDQVERFRDQVYERFGEVAVLTNNAAASPLSRWHPDYPERFELFEP